MLKKLTLAIAMIGALVVPTAGFAETAAGADTAAAADAATESYQIKVGGMT